MEKQPIYKYLKFSRSQSLPMIFQSEVAECGLACLAMVSSYFGHHINLTELRNKINFSSRGINLSQLVKISDRLQLTARPLKVGLEKINRLRTPCILHWDFDHYVVLKSVSNSKYIIHDPSAGVVKLNRDDFNKKFTGVAVELYPTTEFKENKNKGNIKLSKLWGKITGLRSSLLLIFSLSITLQLFLLASPFYLQLVIDNSITSKDSNILTIIFFAFVSLLVFETSTNYARGLAVLKLSTLFFSQVGSNLFSHIIRLPLSYFEKRHIGDIVSRFSSLQQIKQFLSTGIIEAIVDGLMSIVTLIIMYIYQPTLATIGVISSLIYAICRWFSFSPLKNKNEEEIKSLAEESSNFMESIRAIQTIKLFCAEQEREIAWQHKFVNSINKYITISNFNLTFNTITKFIVGIGDLVIVYIGASEVIEGKFSLGMLIAFLAYKRIYSDRAINFIDRVNDYKMLTLYLERLSDIYFTKKEASKLEIVSHSNISGDIDVSGLYFSYSDDSIPIFENFNCKIGQGESVAIIGTSGCGKSTLMKLLLALIKPQQGSIKIDGISIEQLGISNYRTQIASVMQNDELLSGTIAENICFFQANFSMEDIIKYSKLASIHEDVIAMPMGYNSKIGDMGSSLSGGQKQRLFLARALYRKPRILFLDEATSHLDEQTELKINESIKKLQITRVIIAHRNTTIKSADRVIKL